MEYVVDIVGLQKSFRRQTRGRSGYTTIKSSLLSAWRKPANVADRREGWTHAIKDLTLRIPKGVSIGVIGKNGSGKSTFLKLLTGIYKPDGGKVSVIGRVAALIELGAGFHPDFTGRENLYLSALIYGLSRKEVDQRFEEIVNFAELAHVIDDPVRTYSSGMFMRLGFSIAVHTDPDILLVDEVLAVGDAAFVAKCKDKIAELHKAGKTLILVTHDLDAVERWCDEALWLHEGEVKDRGLPRRVIDNYRHFIEKGEEIELLNEESGQIEVAVEPESDLGSPEQRRLRWGSREVEISRVELLGSNRDPKRVFHPEDGFALQIHYLVHAPVTDYVFGIGFNKGDGTPIYGTNTDIERLKLPVLSGSGVVEVSCARLGLLDGAYDLDVAVHRSDGYPYDYHKGVVSFSVRSEGKEVGVSRIPHSWHFDGREVVAG